MSLEYFYRYVFRIRVDLVAVLDSTNDVLNRRENSVPRFVARAGSYLYRTPIDLQAKFQVLQSGRGMKMFIARWDFLKIQGRIQQFALVIQFRVGLAQRLSNLRLLLVAHSKRKDWFVVDVRESMFVRDFLDANARVILHPEYSSMFLRLGDDHGL